MFWKYVAIEFQATNAPSWRAKKLIHDYQPTFGDYNVTLGVKVW